MGLGVALMGGIVSIAIFTMFSLFAQMTSQTHELNLVRSEYVDHEIKFSKTEIDIQSLHAQSGSDMVSLSLLNIGNEKLLDYDNFDIIVTYDADIDSSSVSVTEYFAYNSEQAFSQAGAFSGSSQFARPDEDISKGGWTDVAGGNNNGDLYDEIDEIIRDDTDFSRSLTLTILGQTDTWQAGLSDVLDPQISSDHIVRYAYKKDADGGIIAEITVRLLQGATEIASWKHNNIDQSFILRNQTLSANQADSITNYTDLRLEFIAKYNGGILPGRAIDVSWAELEIPPAAGAYDCFSVGITAGQWTIDRISNDLLDPKILNPPESAQLCIKLSNPVFLNGNVNVVITTDVGKTASESL